ncbi:39S ribosomal protein L53, mitochondrial isoform X1 [Syngnathus typhle]|uniref:39S ribosomal protein L53, mitochondrial isoform X1 n=1 Tax=Syngnathus typhle TaxID=161592 RepID=UPI002A6A26E6|nr:39S ribosomal protein L53, mitochondrial isoform X1 [Syngnathus typhle]
MAAPRRATVMLKVVKKIAIHFCPFEANVRSTREFLVVVGSEKARLTNSNCEVISMVKHDKSEPVVDVTYDYFFIFATQMCQTLSADVNLFRFSCQPLYEVRLEVGKLRPAGHIRPANPE